MKIKELENAPDWLKRAIVQDEDVEIVDGGVVWERGVWKGGIWEGGVWKGGVWEGGVWKDGVWEHGVWEHGTWKGGYIKSLAPPKVLEMGLSKIMESEQV